MTEEAVPDCCILRHRGFAALGAVVFRRAGSDNTPLMVVDLGGREAALPLGALQRELAIPDDSPDGRMLGLIVEALDYVAGVQPGDPLPREVLTGEASWQPRTAHRERALARLRLQLVGWLGSETGNATLSAHTLSVDRLEQDGRLRAHLTAAFTRAASLLDLAGAEAVVALLEGVGEELAYIEALRDLLLARVQALAARLDGFARRRLRGDVSRLDSLAQVFRLTGIALRQIGDKFAELDAQTGEIIATLRNVEGQRIFIRSHRNWLHRSRLAWDPILHAWEAASDRADDGFWLLVARTYQFLAPRFMPVQEWQLFNAARGGRRQAGTRPVLQW